MALIVPLMDLRFSSTAHSVPLRDLMIGLAVVIVWGSNFAITKIALAVFPPLFLAGLRFTLALFPAILFIRRPNVPWKDLIAYGLLIGTGQFALLYIAMAGHISPGLASLVIQIQVAFTIAMSVISSGERVRLFQMIAGGLAAGGIALIAVRAGGSATPLGLGLVLAAALCWAGGNMVSRRSHSANMLAYVVWASLFSAPPLLVLSLAAEGPNAIGQGLAHAGVAAWASVLWQSGANTMFGYALWGWLLSRHPAATIAPMSLLVPVFGMSTSALLLGETLTAWKIEAAALVLSGLALNLFWPRIRSRLGRRVYAS